MYYGTGDPTRWQTFLASLAVGKPVENCPFSTPRFRVNYRDISLDLPHVGPVLTMVVLAHDAEQAREKFVGGRSDAYEIVSVERMPKRGPSQGVRS